MRVAGRSGAHADDPGRLSGGAGTAEQIGNERHRASAMAGVGRITGEPEVLAAALSLLDTVAPAEAGKLREHLRQVRRP